MQTLTRWNPVSSAVTRDPFVRFLEPFFAGDLFRPSLSNGEALADRGWMPAVDIRETDEAYEFQAELPGLTKADVSITLENNTLTLSGERTFEKEANQQSYHRIERGYGKFTRSFTLPTRVDAEGVKAAFEHGILTITVPKVAEVRPRKIEIA